MKWFSNLQTANKLFFSFSIFIVLIVFLIIVSIMSISTLSNLNNSLYHDTFSLSADIIKVGDSNDTIQVALLSMLNQNAKADTTDKAQKIEKPDFDKWLKLIDHATDEQDEKLALISEKIKKDTEFRENFKNLDQLVKESRQALNAKIIPSLINKQFVLAKNLIFESESGTFNKINNFVDVMVDKANNMAKKGIEEANHEKNVVTLILVAIGLAACLITYLLVILLNRLISKPLTEVSLSAKKIALGEIRNPMISSSDRADEVGVLGSTFQKMVQWLQSVEEAASQISNGDLTVKVDLQSKNDILGHSFQNMIKNLNMITEEISEIINVINASANEIGTAVSELSSSASETATSISETTTTIEEVKQTSQVANQKAKLVADTAKKTAEMAQTGKKATDELNEVIDEIHKQMGSIAETMMKLNEQSQAVGVIIATVEDLAQQTNLLSVNAAIEASKAGEQGKGFSVVAQEVKSLATQSKQATTQVRAILDDIQKAASAAVIATEMGSKAVAMGVKKTSDASNTINTLMKSVSEASQAAAQIAAVSHQQLIGMEQANVAMENIKLASKQNVDSAKLLNKSIKQITDLGIRLKSLIGKFKLNKKH